MGGGFFPKMLPFCECNSVRIGQNIQNEVSLERYIFADVVAYQFIQLKLKAKCHLVGPGMNVDVFWHHSIWVVRKGLIRAFRQKR